MSAHRGLRTRIPFLRWSFLRMMFGIRKLTTEWQVGDGREDAVRDYVLANAKAGDVDDAIRAIDEYAYQQKFLINVGDEKGAILDAALRRAAPKLILELGAYVGYSGLRMASVMPEGARIVSVEFLEANAEITRAIWRHAGIDDRATVVVGTLGDGGGTADVLAAEHGFALGSVDFVFLDHDKDAYLPDTELLLERGWLHPGSILVADNVKFPGAPEYRKFMQAGEGTTWRTTEHETHAEYQTMLKDLVLESEHLGAPAAP